MTPKTKRDTITAAELHEALEALSATDRIRLERKARFHCGGTGMDWEDLLQEAICRALDDNGRKCPRDVDLQVFLGNAMRSIADTERQKQNRQVLPDATNDEVTTIKVDEATATDPEGEILHRISCQQTAEHIEKLFANDQQVLAIILGDMNGWSPAEICELEPMNEKEFAAARKRARRTLLKEFQKGPGK